MSTFQPPPTWALPININEKTKEATFSPVWLRWFIELAANLDGGGLPVSGVFGPGASTNHSIPLWDGTTGSYLKNFASLGTTTKVLHGNATGVPSWDAVSLTADVSGTLPVANGGTGITALGTGVATALGVNVGSVGAFVVVGGALGTPSSGVGTNLTGTASGLTAGNVTTNANLTGAVTSTGNATVLGSFTSAQLATALTDETGSGVALFATAGTTVGTAAAMVKTAVALNDGAAAGAGTLLNAPAAGNPTKWVPIDDNGTTRYVPAW